MTGSFKRLIHGCCSVDSLTKIQWRKNSHVMTSWYDICIKRTYTTFQEKRLDANLQSLVLPIVIRIADSTPYYYDYCVFSVVCASRDTIVAQEYVSEH